MSHAQGEVSPELDMLSCELLGDAFDRLADAQDVNVLLVTQNGSGEVTPYEFAEDGAEACLQGAHEKVRELGEACELYALCYEGSVDAEGDGVYHDAVILEFGQRGWPTYSAYCLFQGKGAGEQFAWADPQPAGELESLFS